MPLTTETLAALATEYPAAIEVFRNHKFDYCCGGDQRLDEVCQLAGLDPKQVLAEVEAAKTSNEDRDQQWCQLPLDELIEHIIQRYHVPLRRELPVLIEMAGTVERVHGVKHTCPVGLTVHLEQVLVAVEGHLEKEEQILFPLILAGRSREAMMPVRVLTEEHEDHGRDLRRLRELTLDITAPPEACVTWTGLYRRLEQLEADLMEHIHLENNVLFPRALTARCDRSTPKGEKS